MKDDSQIKAKEIIPRRSTTSKVKSSIVSDSISFGIAFALVITVVQRIVGFGRGVLFCRALPEDELGQWSMVYSFLLLLAPLSVMGLPGSFGRYLERYRQSGQMGGYVSRLTWVSSIGAAILVGFMVLVPDAFSKLIFGQTGVQELVFAMAFALVCVVTFNFLTSLLEGLRQVRLVSVMRFAMAIGFAVLGLAFAFTWANGAIGATVAFGIANLVGIAPAVLFLFRHRSEFVDEGEPIQGGRLWKQVVPFATWMWLINFVSNAYEVADRVMLLHLSPGTSEAAQAAVGQYHSGRLLPMMLVGVAALVGGFVMPYMSAAWEIGKFEKAKELMRWVLKLIGFGFTAVSLVLLLLAPIVFDWVLERRYDDGLSVLPMTLVYCIWYSLITVGQDYLWCREKGKIALLAVAAGLVVNIAANFVAIPYWGLQGAVIATAFSNLFCLVFLMWINQQAGWNVDRGTWIAAGVPLVLMMPVHYAIVAFALISFGCIRFEWVFNQREKRQINEELIGKLPLGPIGRRLGWSRTL